MNLFQIMQGAQNGTLDAKSEVYKIIQSMTPIQRRVAISILPKVEGMAKQAGLSTDEFSKEARAKLL